MRALAGMWGWIRGRLRRAPAAPACFVCGGEPIYCEHTSMRVLHGILENKCLDEFAVDGYAAPGQIVFAISNMHKVSTRNRCLHECACRCAGYETEEAND